MSNPHPVSILQRDLDGVVSSPPDAIAAGRLGATSMLSVVVVDPQAAVREGLPVLLRSEQIDVVASAGTGGDGEALVERHQPDIALIALDLADVDGVVLLRRLLQRGTRSAIVLYADDENGDQAAVAVHAGAAGVIAKRRTIAELADALRVVAGGGLWFNEAPEPPAVRAPLVVLDARERRTGSLSDAELRVLALVADGSSTEEVALALSLSPHTVRTHLRNVMRKLEASSRAHAVAIAIRESAIEI
jgi:DNA-binding NarL/FixJ family response regulator